MLLTGTAVLFLGWDLMNYETVTVACQLLCPHHTRHSRQPLSFVGCNPFSLSPIVLVHVRCQATTSQESGVWGPKTLTRQPQTIFLIHTRRTMFVHINKTKKTNVASGLFALVSFLHFLFFHSFSHEFPCSDVHMVEWYSEFSGCVYKVDHTSFKLTKHFPYLLSTDFSKLWSSEAPCHTNMLTLLNTLSVWAVVGASLKNIPKAFILFSHYTLSNSS